MNAVEAAKILQLFLSLFHHLTLAQIKDVQACPRVPHQFLLYPRVSSQSATSYEVQ